MKTPLALVALAAAQLSAFAADDLPKPLAFARYEGMTTRSPFAVATAATPPPQAPNFAKDLYIANAAKLSDEGVVTLASNVDKNMKEYLTTKGPNKNGYSISNIDADLQSGAAFATGRECADRTTAASATGANHRRCSGCRPSECSSDADHDASGERGAAGESKSREPDQTRAGADVTDTATACAWRNSAESERHRDAGAG